MADMVMQKGKNYDSVRYYDIRVWSCIIFVKEWITLPYKLLLQDNSQLILIVVNKLIGGL